MVMDNAIKKRNSGFTLAEVLIAISLLAIGMLGLLTATTKTVRLLGEGNRTAEAAYYANDRLERLSARGCLGATLGSDTAQGIYKLKWTVSGTVSSRARDVLLVVRYPMTRGRERADTFEKAMPCN